MEGYGTGAAVMRLEDLVHDVGLVDLVEDTARLALRAQLEPYTTASYPGFTFRRLELYSTYVVKSHGRRPFTMNVRPRKSAWSDSVPELEAATTNFTKQAPATAKRCTVWCAGVPGIRPQRSAEVVAIARVTVSADANPEARFWYDVAFVHWHVPVRHALQPDVVTEMKPSRAGPPDFSERPPLPPGAPPRVETDDERRRAEFAYVSVHGSRALAASSVRVPVDAYHDHVPADVVGLGLVYALVPPRCIVGRADLVPCYEPDLYGTAPGALPNQQRPPFFRMYPRA